MVENSANGLSALFNNTTGNNNTATGVAALATNTEGFDNSATGFEALLDNTTGHWNTAIGSGALVVNTTGIGNTAVGHIALNHNTTGGGNIAFAAAGNAVTTAIGVIAVGHGGGNVSNSCFIGNIRDVATHNNDAIPVVIDSYGQLGTASSSRRFKKEIKPMDKASEAILALKPVHVSL